MQPLLQALIKIDRAVSFLARTICVVSLAAIFLMFISNIFVRFVPIYNFTQTDDWIQFCLIWMIFLGAQELFRTRNHFVVDVITERIAHKKIGQVLRVLVTLIELVTYVLICYYGWLWVMRANATMQSIPWMQMRYTYMAIPVSAFFMSCYGLRDLILSLRTLKRS